MKHTSLTVGGFTQPSVARNLIEISANVEKGLCQRFLWVVPRPTPVSFEELGQVERDFSTALSMYFARWLHPASLVITCGVHAIECFAESLQKE